MYTNIEIFQNEEFGAIRTVLIGEKPWFVGKDVAIALGYSEPRSAVSKKVEPEDRGVAEMATPSGNQNMTIINESGLYALIFGSKLESAKRFKHWVTSEVLPSVRKTGTYSMMPETQCTISARELAAILKRKQCKVCYRIDALIRQYPEYKNEFIPRTFRNIQGREFRTYDLTEKGLNIFVKLLSADGNRNSLNTVKGIQRIKDLYPEALQDCAMAELPDVSLCLRTGLKELQKAEAALEMFEQCYLGADFAEFDNENRERFDAALCLLHDQVKAALEEAKGAWCNE